MTSSQTNIFEEIEAAYKDKKRVKRWLVVSDRYLKTYNNNTFERHWTAGDIVNEVITKTLEGKRNRHAEKVPDLDKYMFMTIRSVVDDKLGKARVVEPADEFVRGSKEFRAKKSVEKSIIHEIIDPVEEINIKLKFDQCYNELLEDEDAAIVFLEWKEGKTSKEIANSLGIPVDEVELIKKRIRYNLKKTITKN